jgi:hypothetical protein
VLLELWKNNNIRNLANPAINRLKPTPITIWFILSFIVNNEKKRLNNVPIINPPKSPNIGFCVEIVIAAYEKQILS